jgi:hypothetical protein
MSEHKDKSPLVEITVHATDILFTNCDYPEPTKEMVIEKMRELLDEGNISYSEKRHPQTTITSAIEKINKEPISSVLETFGDIDEAIQDARAMQHEIAIGRASEEQGGNRESNLYNEDKDPLNE